VVSKVRDSQYRSGRSNDWVKKTCAQRETLTIAGFALDGNKWDGIYVGRRKSKDLIYAGKVDHGFDTASAAGGQRPGGLRLLAGRIVPEGGPPT
jgi:bifunctional non-homologous end joining protein LigD